MRRIRTVLLVTALLVVMLGGGGVSVGCAPFGSPTSPGPPPGEANIEGTVTHILTGTRIPNVTVRITPNGMTQLSVIADANGRYGVAGINTGTARITTSVTGYRDYTADVSLVRGNNTHNIQLVPNP